MQNYQKNQKKYSQIANRVVVIAAIIAVFVTVFLITNMGLQIIYGYDFENSIAYNEVMNATKDAANKTEGMMIDQYVANIENQTLGGGI